MTISVCSSWDRQWKDNLNSDIHCLSVDCLTNHPFLFSGLETEQYSCYWWRDGRQLLSLSSTFKFIPLLWHLTMYWFSLPMIDDMINDYYIFWEKSSFIVQSKSSQINVATIIISNDIPTNVPIDDDVIDDQLVSVKKDWRCGKKFMLKEIRVIIESIMNWFRYSVQLNKLLSLLILNWTFPLIFIFSEYFSLMLFTIWKTFLFNLEIKILVFFFRISKEKEKKEKKREKKEKKKEKKRVTFEKWRDIHLKNRGRKITIELNFFEELKCAISKFQKKKTWPFSKLISIQIHLKSSHL